MNMTSITIELPDDLMARIEARRPSEMTMAHIVSLLAGLGFTAVSKAQMPSLDFQAGSIDQRVEIVAMHLRDRLRMYLDKIGSRNLSDEPETVAAVEEVIGAAMASGWASACFMIASGFCVDDINRAITSVCHEFDYKIEILE